MKSLILLSILICSVIGTAFAQIDNTIPTPKDLQEKGIKILTKEKLADGTIVIRYKNKNGHIIRRETPAAKEGEIPQSSEWNETNPGPKGIDPGKEQFAIKATGTGQTTGHIANLTVTNTNDFPINILPQMVYIPSGGQYQPYIGRIPGTSVPPGTTVVPVDGYCADVHTPPVPSGNPMPPIEDWIPVGDPGAIIPDGTVNIIPTTPIPPFEDTDIPNIVTTPGYRALPPIADADMIITWPGTDIPVGGTLDPKSNPEVFAPVIVKVLEEIELAYDVIRQRGEYTTPFSGVPEKEEPAVIQQTFWMWTSSFSGEKYEKENFAEKVIDQYEDNTGKTLNTLPAEQKEKLEEGIDDFWNVFTAVGVEAKVITVKSPAAGKADSKDEGKPQGATTEDKKKGECSCESITFSVNTDFGGLPQKVKDVTITKLGSGGSESIVIERSEKDFPNEVKITVTNILVKCNPCGEIPCEPYARKKEGDTDKIESDRKNKVKISKPEMGNPASGKKIGDEKIGDNSIEITTKPNDPKQSSYYITFRIDATCMAADCTKAWCYRDVTIEVRKLTDAEKAKREKEAEAERIKAEKKAEAERKKAEKAAKKVKKG